MPETRCTPLSLTSLSLVALALAAPSRGQRTLAQTYGPVAGERFGATLATLGDVDGDGSPDLVAGTPDRDEPGLFGRDAGGAHVIGGRTGGLLARAVLPLNPADSRFGTAICAVGDLNGNGAPDFVLGAPVALGGVGAVTAHDGRTGALLWTRTAYGSNLREFGAALTSCGDVTGDGRPDVMVGYPSDVGGAPGVIGINGTDGRTVGIVVTGNANSRCGTSLTALSDLNGDGRLELAVGEPEFNFVGNSGRVRVLDPVTYWLPPVYQIYQGIGYAYGLGQRVANGGDLDGDGKDDLLVS